MAVTAKDASGATVNLKSTTDGSDQVIHHRIDGTVTTNATAPTSNVHGKVAVTTAGARVQVSSSSVPLTRGAWIRAAHINAGTIYLGNVTVTSANGYDMTARDTVFIECSDLNQLYIDASADGQSISYIGF